MCLGIPGRIVEVHEDRGLPMGTVDFGGVRREVCLAYVANDIQVGDYAIIHVGFAISKVQEEEARRIKVKAAEIFAEHGWKVTARKSEVEAMLAGDLADFTMQNDVLNRAKKGK